MSFWKRRQPQDITWGGFASQLGGSPDFGTSPWSEEADEVANMWREKYESELRKVARGY